MKSICFIVLYIISVNGLFGQQKPGYLYNGLIFKAQFLYKQKDYVKSAQAYTDAFKEYKSYIKANDYYDAACSYSLGNLPDSAFFYLFLAADKKKYNNVSHIQSDSDLSSLHTARDWQKILNKIKNNQYKAGKKYNKKVVSILDTIYNFDQGGRKKIEEINNKFGSESNESKEFVTKLNMQDSLNLIKVTSIIDRYGWLGAKKVGEHGNTTIFLVIQHADKNIHEKYLPAMRTAVRKGNAKSEHLALLEDRTALEKGEKQIYGSQIIRNKNGKPEIAPIEDEKNVDLRRQNVGLGKLKDYAKIFHIDYKNIDTTTTYSN